jgi:hypothetical protein
VAVLAVVAMLAFDARAFAVGHNTPTSPTISRRLAGRVDPDTKVTIRGRSGSPRRACTRNKIILLMRVDKGVVDGDWAKDEGRYRFERRSRRTNQFFAKIRGTRRGVHPNLRISRASRSRTITIRVQ